MTTFVSGSIEGNDLVFLKVDEKGHRSVWKAVTVLKDDLNAYTCVLEVTDDLGNTTREIRVIQKEDYTMSQIKWDQTGEKTYELGVDHGVLYRHVKNKDQETGKTTVAPYAKGYAWNGLTSIDEGVEGGESNKQYADNIVYLNLMGTEEFNPTINAFTYPDAFKECDGSKELLPGVYISAQDREEFGLSYRTKIGNDVDGESHAYKIHMVYGCKAEPSERTYETVNDTPEAMELSWDCTTTPVDVTGAKPTAHLFFESDKVNQDFLKALEEILYGTDDTEPRMPLPDEIVKLYNETVGTDNGNTTNP